MEEHWHCLAYKQDGIINGEILICNNACLTSLKVSIALIFLLWIQGVNENGCGLSTSESSIFTEHKMFMECSSVWQKKLVQALHELLGANDI